MLIQFLIVTVFIVTMSACQSTPTSRPPSDLSGADPYLLLSQAENAGGSRAAELRLQAAQVLVADGAFEQARQVLAAMQADRLGAVQRADRLSTLAEALLGLGRAADAQQTMAGLTRLRPRDWYVLAGICAQLSDFRCSADAYITAGLTAPADAQWLPEDLHDRIWLALSRARSAPRAFTDSDHHAWWLLQENIRTAGSITAQLSAWQDWRQRYPEHPASLRPPAALESLNTYRAPQVGLLLPLSGPYGTAGSAVRDGLIAAYLSERGAERPRVNIYDTAEAPLAQLYEQALREGADVLVGPLIREEVEAFVELSAYADTPRLVLNYLTEPAEPMPLDAPGIAQFNMPAAELYQFGIAIEDEAVSLANHMLLTGHERLLVVHSTARWSERALEAYQQAWPYALTVASFGNIQSLTGAVGEAMQVAASEARKNELANILGEPLEFLPRARGDLDAVVALTTQIEAQALVPALRFHFADDLPVFATSQAARGDALADLAGFELTEMPIFSSPEPEHFALRDAFKLKENPLGELYALGYDAYRLATWLPILQPQSQVALPGATGYLWLAPDGKFHRDLKLSRIDPSGQRIPQL